jgi:hypothetical protein
MTLALRACIHTSACTASMLHDCGFLSICQITALMVLHVPCLQRVLLVTASIDNLPTLAGANGRFVPGGYSHSQTPR